MATQKQNAQLRVENALQTERWCSCPIHTLFPQRISDLVEPTVRDLKAACALIGNDTYGKPHWNPETIHPHNSVVQAFARHALAERTKATTHDATRLQLAHPAP